jgi:mannose-6-phosphate isomerase-like protein (cupin superfamily)
VTIGRAHGSGTLEQRVVRFAPGTSMPEELVGEQAVIYVVAGAARLLVGDETVELEPDTGAYVAAGEAYRVENPGPEELVAVIVTAAQERSARPDGQRAARFPDRPVLAASRDRTFRYLVDSEVGCRDVTQFLGLIAPGREEIHSHTYDEVLYVVEGEGLLHVGEESTPIGPGTCIHLPPRIEHIIENSGETQMRVLGVFHPAGDPAGRADD